MSDPDVLPPVRTVQRLCIACLQTDDAPRHVRVGSEPRHIDCCAASGCSLCAASLDAAGGAKDDELRDRLRRQEPRVVVHADGEKV